jgi:mono/diheme cytochrome c family protein
LHERGAQPIVKEQPVQQRGGWPIAAVAVVLVTACSAEGTSSAPGAASVDEARGEQLFDANCAMCHGPAGTGTTSGPPLVHEIYEPGHHSDEAFQLAVAQGSPQHHWDFGPMPSIAGLDRDEVADITAYVRTLQRDAGIID